MHEGRGWVAVALLSVGWAGCVGASESPVPPEVEAMASALRPIATEPWDETGLASLVGDADVVLLGEDTRGTHEFYEVRAGLTKRLIDELGFSAVAVEGDWSEVSNLNAWVQDASSPDPFSAQAPPQGWTWHSAPFREVADHLRQRRAAGFPAAIYGLALDDLPAALAKSAGYLQLVSTEAGTRADAWRTCFLDAGGTSALYAAAALKGEADCREEAEALLAEVESTRDAALASGALDAWFDARESARVVRDAEAFLRAPPTGPDSAWNLRERHLLQTLQAILEHRAADPSAPRPRVVVWTHNAHAGDGRATEQSARGELTLGQLLREDPARQPFLIGLSTYEGRVTASSHLGGPPEEKELPAAREDSYEAFLHQTGVNRFLLPLHDAAVVDRLSKSRRQRTIDAVFSPPFERDSNYQMARLPEQFDALLHVDQTTALKPATP